MSDCYGLLCAPHSYVDVLTPSTSDCDRNWNLYRVNQTKIMSLEWALVQYAGCPYKKDNLNIETSIERRRYEDRAKERGLEWILPSQPPEGTSPADSLISDFWPPEL